MTFDRKIEDAGLERGVSRLTPERIENTLKQVIEGEAGAKLKLYAETCMRCGMCSEACHYYMSHEGDPSYSPAGKVHQTLGKILRKNYKVTADEIYEMAQIAYTECNLCRRCVHFCPLGIDTGYIMSMVRRMCHKLGVTPPVHSGHRSFPFRYLQPDVAQR